MVRCWLEGRDKGEHPASRGQGPTAPHHEDNAAVRAEVGCQLAGSFQHMQLHLNEARGPPEASQEMEAGTASAPALWPQPSPGRPALGAGLGGPTALKGSVPESWSHPYSKVRMLP